MNQSVEKKIQKEIYPTSRKRASKSCTNCKTKHVRCGFKRPCMRCDKLGLDCMDRPRKSRGQTANKICFIDETHKFCNKVRKQHKTHQSSSPLTFKFILDRYTCLKIRKQ